MLGSCRRDLVCTEQHTKRATKNTVNQKKHRNIKAKPETERDPDPLLMLVPTLIRSVSKIDYH